MNTCVKAHNYSQNVSMNIFPITHELRSVPPPFDRNMQLQNEFHLQPSLLFPKPSSGQGM